VGVTGDDHRRHVPAAALVALDVPADAHVGDLPAELGHAGPQPAPVRLDLGLTGAAGTDPATAGHPATGLPGQGFTPATQAGQHVGQLGQLDLSLALAAARA